MGTLVGKHALVVGGEPCELAASRRGLAVAESVYAVLEGGERAYGVLHLVVHIVPVNFRVIEIVEFLVVAYLLTIIYEWHAIEGELKHGERITVVAIHVGKGAAAPVLVVVGEIHHTVEVAIAAVVEEVGNAVLQCCAIGATTVASDVVGQTSGLEAPGIVVVPTNVELPLSVGIKITFGKEVEIALAAGIFGIVLDEGNG